MLPKVFFLIQSPSFPDKSLKSQKSKKKSAKGKKMEKTSTKAYYFRISTVFEVQSNHRKQQRKSN